MFLFWRLILAHLIADFPLQTDRIFVIKMKHPWGVVVHASVAGGLGFLFAGRYLRYPDVVVGLLLLWIAHIIIDKAKLMVNRKLEKERVDLFLADQAVHVLLIWLVAQIAAPKGDLPIRVAGLSRLYNSDLFVKFLSGYIVATYGIMLLIYSIRSTIGLKAELPTLKQKLIEFAERGSIVTMAVLGGVFYALVPVFLLPRIVLSLRENPKYRKLDVALSAIFSLLIGAVLTQLKL